MVSRTIARNQTQRIGQTLRGSRITVLGSGGFTESAVGDGVVSVYSPPAGRKARIKGTFTAIALGSNTQIGAGIFDNTTGFRSDLAVLAGVGQQTFETLLTDNENITFFGDNIANDGTAGCTIEITELPA